LAKKPSGYALRVNRATLENSVVTDFDASTALQMPGISLLSVPDRLTLTAIHEAGHAVGGGVLDFEPVKAEIHSDGHGLTAFQRRRLSESEVELWCLRALAGSEAERLFFLSLLPDDGIDQQHVREKLGAAYEASIARLRDQTAALVRQHSETIAALALSLIRKHDSGFGRWASGVDAR